MKTWKSTLLTEACKLYINCELFITELNLVAIFTHKVTLTFLNCIGMSTKKELLEFFSKFHCDLLNHNMDTLQDLLCTSAEKKKQKNTN